MDAVIFTFQLYKVPYEYEKKEKKKILSYVIGSHIDVIVYLVYEQSHNAT